MQLTPQPSPPEAEGEATFLPAVAVELLSQVPQRAATSALLGALRPSPWAHTVLLPVAPQHPGNAQQCAQLLASPPHWGRPPAGTHSLSHRSSPARLQHILGASGLVVLVGWASGPQAQQDEAGQRVGCSHLRGAQGRREMAKRSASLGVSRASFHGASLPWSIPSMEHLTQGAFPLWSIPSPEHPPLQSIPSMYQHCSGADTHVCAAAPFKQPEYPSGSPTNPHPAVLSASFLLLTSPFLSTRSARCLQPCSPSPGPLPGPARFGLAAWGC